MIGQKVAHYRITASIGAGGMGQVYRATDTKLHRDVALKVLPPEMASSPERLERFQREARAVAALNHAGVVTIYSVEEADGVHFLTMELVEGEPLDRLIPAGGMAVTRMLDIAGGLADALCAAHDKGIVHRDLKPANVMVTNSEAVKVLDFGLARMTAPAEASHTVADDQRTEMRTSDGVVMGTMPYMSPEQLHGQALDHRTDIFSLGVMLYEMASGERPFRGDSSAALASAILRDTPKPLAERRNDLPEGLIRIISRCLEKSAAARFPSARDLRGALGGVVDGSTQRAARDVTGRKIVDRVQSDTNSRQVRADEGFGVAVIPFKFSGAHSELEALAAGLTEDIVTGFLRFTWLRVRSAGNEAGARYVMEGSLRQIGAKVRLAVQFVDTESGTRIWAETYDRTFDPDAVFELQDDLVQRIVGTCADRFGVLARSISDAVRVRDPAGFSSYEALMRGFGYHHRLTETEHAAAREVLERAVERSPSNADCWAMLSWVISQEYGHGFNAREASLDRALTAARRAVDIAPASALAQQALAVVSFFRKEKAACLSAAERAIALNPLDTSNEAMFLIAFSGDWDRGCALIRRAMDLNPHHPRWYELSVSINDYRMANYQAAVDEVVRANAPEIFWCNMILAAAHAQLGEHAAARNALRELLAQKGDLAQSVSELLSRWFEPQLVAHLIDGLRMAGLSLPLTDGAEDPLEESPERAPTKAQTTRGTDSGSRRAEDGFWVAVLPFRYSGSNPELAALAEGLSEDIVTGMSRFSYLRVISRSSTSRYSTEATDVRSAARELGARYVMEGSLRQVGAKLRVAVQLVDAESGANLWAENYERSFSPESVFEIQDELVPRIVSTVGDQHGALVHSMSESLQGKDPAEYSAHEAVVRMFGFWERVTPEEHRQVREIIEAAAARNPGHSDCLAALAQMYYAEYAWGYNPGPDPLGRAKAAAQRAVAAGPANHYAHSVLASVLFFQKDYQAFRTAADRALSLNRMDSSTAAILGQMIAYAGDWDDGMEVMNRVIQLNPHHPGWYYYLAFCDAYRRRDYKGALAIALKVNMPGYHWPHVYLAAAYGQLGEHQRARTALRDLDAVIPNFGAVVREELGKWLDDELTEHLLEGLSKAGMEIPSPNDDRASAPASSAAASPISGAVRADEGFWVAVLPFRYSGANADLTALAEGLTEEIVTGLARFSYLRVIARGSTSRLARDTVDVRSIGRELGARYVMEGSIRQAGSSLRVAAQLVDAESGAHLWAETYSRPFEPSQIFEVQDDVAPRIVSTVADMNGVLPHMMSEVLRGRRPEELTPYEAVLRSFGYLERLNAEEHAEVRAALEHALQTAPGYSDGLAMLSNLHAEEFKHGFNARPDPLGRALDAARRAVAAAPSNHLAYHVLAQALFFRREFAAFRVAAERAVALNPMDGCTTAFMGILLAYAGDWERGVALAERAMELNPNHPGWYRFAAFTNAFRNRDYRAALDVALEFNMPSYFYTHAALAAAYGHLGEREAATNALRELLTQKPDFALIARQELAKWNGPELLAEYMEGLRKAGLSVPPADGS